MADQKLTALTEKTAISDGTSPNDDHKALLYIVEDPTGTPTGKKIELETILGRGYAQIASESGGSVTMGIAATWYTITAFDTNYSDPEYRASGDQANNKIVLADPGIYLVMYQMSFSGTQNDTLQFRVNWNAGGQDQTGCTRKLGNNDVGSCSGMGLVYAVGAGSDTDLILEAQVDSENAITVEKCQLVAVRLL